MIEELRLREIGVGLIGVLFLGGVFLLFKELIKVFMKYL